MKTTPRAAAALATATLALGLVTPAANAVIVGQPLGTGETYNGSWWAGSVDNRHYLGNYGLFSNSGVLAYCGNPEELGPRGTTYGNVQVTEDTPQMRQLGYVLDKWGQTTNPGQAAAVQAVTYHLLGKRDINSAYAIEQQNKASTSGLIEVNNKLTGQTGTGGYDVRASALAILGDAQAHAGAVGRGYDIKLDVPKTGQTVKPGEEVTGEVTILAASGQGMHGIPVKFTFGNKAQVVYTGGDGRAKVHFSADESGTFTLDAEIDKGELTDLPTVALPADPSHQRMFMAGNGAGWADPAMNDVLVSYAPTITTTSSATGKQSPVGTEVQDTVTVTGGKPGGTIAVMSTLYGPLPTEPVKSAGAPSGAPEVRREWVNIQLDADGNGTATSTPYQVTTPGWYTYDTDFGGDTAQGMSAYDAGYGVPEETGEFIAYTPVVSTQTNQVLISGPRDLADIVTISGGKPGEAFTGSSTLYGPFDHMPTAADQASAPKVGVGTFSGTFDSAGRAKVTTTPVAVSAAGYYTWVETLDATSTSGPVTGEFGVTSETTLNYAPTIATKVSSQKVIPGATLTDTATLSGIRTSIGTTKVTNVVTGGLYGPAEPVDGDCKAVPAEAYRKAGKVADIPATAVTKDGDMPGLGSWTIPDGAAGCYSYGETLKAFVDNDGNQVPDNPAEVVTVEHEVGKESQTALVTRPAMTTTTSSQVVSPGKQVFDTVHVTGTNGATGTIEAVLYGYATPVDNQPCSTITDEKWRGLISEGKVKALATETITVDRGDGDYVTKPVTLDGLGCATWYEKATFGDFTTETPHGVPSETTLVITPKVSTVAQAQGTTAGSTLLDKVLVTGTHGQKGVVTGKVLGPVQPKNGTDCVNVDWSKAPTTSELEKLVITGDGEYTTKAVKTGTAGCYTFVETLTMDAKDVAPVHTQPGEVTETVYMSENSSLTGGDTTPVSTLGGGIKAGVVAAAGEASADPAKAAAGGLAGLAGLLGLGWFVARMRRRQAS